VTDRQPDGTDPAGVEAQASAPAEQPDTSPTPESASAHDKRHPAGPAQVPAHDEPADPKRDEEEESRPTVVVRDRRKVKDPGKADAPAAGSQDAGSQVAESPATEVAPEPAADPAAAPAEPVTGEPVTVAGNAEPSGPGAFGAELEALRSDVDELTRDLQRITAEYANYRKRVDRDRGLVTEQATGLVLAALLPVLDDIDRAREHGDLVGPFGSVAEQLTNSLTKFGLTPFGEKGDPFDPTRHEAVAHQTSTEVTEPTCVDILRRGYLLGDRLLRPALVAVADPG
jgi:molecular chaperone GrpE